MRISDWSSDVCSSDLQCGAVERSGNPKEHGHRENHRQADPAFVGCKAKNGCADNLQRQCAAGNIATVETIGHPARHGGEQEQGQERSEEHTSELQSLMRISYAGFCLKKKNY